MLINYKNKLFVLVFSILIFTFSCKQENADPEPNVEEKVIEPIKIETNDFSDISSNGVKLFGKINYLNEEEILDAGFIISTINKTGNKDVEKEYSIGKNVSIGEVSYVYRPASPLEQNATHSYQFYIRTVKNYYKGGFEKL